MAQCTATANRTGQRCAMAAMKGGTVCRVHGGRAPQVKRAAKRRLSEAEAHEAARLGLVKGSRVEDPFATLQELTSETNAIRKSLAGKMAAAPSEMVDLLQSWGNVLAMQAKLLTDWMRQDPRYQQGTVEPMRISLDFGGAAVSSDNSPSTAPLPTPPATPAIEPPAPPDPPEPVAPVLEPPVPPQQAADRAEAETLRQMYHRQLPNIVDPDFGPARAHRIAPDPPEGFIGGLDDGAA